MIKIWSSSIFLSYCDWRRSLVNYRTSSPTSSISNTMAQAPYPISVVNTNSLHKWCGVWRGYQLCLFVSELYSYSRSHHPIIFIMSAESLRWYTEHISNIWDGMISNIWDGIRYLYPCSLTRDSIYNPLCLLFTYWDQSSDESTLLGHKINYNITDILIHLSHFRRYVSRSLNRVLYIIKTSRRR